jgi:hypothetical protein
MSTETRREAAGRDGDPNADGEGVGDDEDVASVDDATDGEAPQSAAADDARNGVTVHFENGDAASYAFVVRSHDADWLYAERLRGDADGFDDEEVEAINAATVCRIVASRVHLFGDGVVHFGDDLLVDPTTLLADSWFDADPAIR